MRYHICNNALRKCLWGLPSSDVGPTDPMRKDLALACLAKTVVAPDNLPLLFPNPSSSVPSLVLLLAVVANEVMECDLATDIFLMSPTPPAPPPTFRKLFFSPGLGTMRWSGRGLSSPPESSSSSTLGLDFRDCPWLEGVGTELLVEGEAGGFGSSENLWLWLIGERLFCLRCITHLVWRWERKKRLLLGGFETYTTLYYVIMLCDLK